MRKKPNLTRLALSSLPVIVLVFELVNVSLELVSKVVNYYDRQIRNLPLLLPA
jgi:hypothetical protein